MPRVISSLGPLIRLLHTSILSATRLRILTGGLERVARKLHDVNLAQQRELYRGPVVPEED